MTINRWETFSVIDLRWVVEILLLYVAKLKLLVCKTLHQDTSCPLCRGASQNCLEL